MQRVRQAPTARLTWVRLPTTLALWPIVALLLGYGIVYLQFAAQLAAFPFDLDQGEGYDAWSGWLINLGHLPYSNNAEFPYYSSNYPPLWSYLVSIPMAWSGPGLGAARAISTVAALAAAGALGLAAYRLSGRRLAAVLASGFFLASPYVFHTTPLARVNSLALLAAVAGLTLLEQPTRRRVVFGSLALAAALFTKPTALDAAAAGVLGVLLHAPVRGTLAALIVGGLFAAGTALMTRLTDGAFWTNVVAGNVNPFDAHQLAGYLSNFTLLHCVLLATAIAQGVYLARRRIWSPWLLYAISAGIGALGVAKWGAGESYFLSAIAATCVLSAAWIARFLDSAPSVRMRWSLGTALLIQGLLLSHASVSTFIPWLSDRAPQAALLGRAPALEDLQTGLLLSDQIRRARGPALSEDPSLAVFAGKPLVGNATHLRNLYHAGLWDPSPMVNDLLAHRYAIVVLDAELYPEPVLAAIGQAYFLDRTVRINGASYQVFLPGSQ